MIRHAERTRLFVALLIGFVLIVAPSLVLLGTAGGTQAARTGPAAAVTAPAGPKVVSDGASGSSGSAASSLPAVAPGPLQSAISLVRPLDLRAGVPSVVPSAGIVALSYSAAASLMTSAASLYFGGTWNVTVAVGLALPYTVTIPVTNSTFSGLCGFAYIGTPPTTLTLTQTPISASTGTAAWYEFYLSSLGAAGTIVFGLVNNGTATLIFQQTAGPGCSPIFGSALTVVPSGILDSPAAVSAANAAGGAAFLLAHSGSTQEWEIAPGGYAISSDGTWTMFPPLWSVSYASGSCGGFAGPMTGSGAYFAAEIDAWTGAVIGSTSFSCAYVDYPVTFTETGLPTGTNWSVEMSGTNFSTSSTVGFTVSNGTYFYTVPNVPGYVPTPASGAVTVNGTGANVSIVFSPMATYDVTFTESGLLSGTVWAVGLSGQPYQSTSATSIVFVEPTGVYTYFVSIPQGYWAAPASGTVTVTSSAVTTPIQFSLAATYSVSFGETGLPSGISWGVELFGSSNTSFYVERNLTTASSLSFALPNGNYSFTVGSTSPAYNATPTTGVFTVAGSAVSQPVTFSQRAVFSVTFAEAGLPTGTAWYVGLGGFAPLNSSTTSTIGFVMPNESTPFAAGGAPGYAASPSSGFLVVNGSAVRILVNFTYTGPTYAVTFVESGLPSSTLWNVVVSGNNSTSTNSSIAVHLANGTWAYTVGPVPGFVASPAFGNLTVSGSAVTVSIVFAHAYGVSFAETGLTAGTSWSVVVHSVTGSSTASSIQFFEPNGTFNFSVAVVPGYFPSPLSGRVTVNGASLLENVTFTALPAGQFWVQFDESGLPSGTSWSVTLNGTTQTSTTSSVHFVVANGTYTFTASGAHGYAPTRSTGSLTVSGASPTPVSIVFTAVKVQYSVTFTETGLPSGTSWSVTVNGTVHTSTGTSTQLTEPNGTYAFTVGSVAGYNATPSSGSVAVSGGNVSRSLTFTAVSGGGSGGSGPTFLGLPATEGYLLLVGLIIVVVAILGGAWAARRSSRRKKEDSGAPPAGAMPPPPPA